MDQSPNLRRPLPWFLVASAVVLAAQMVAVPHASAAADTDLVSKDSGGVGGDQDSNDASISGNGRKVAFSSLADNLSDADDVFPDIFVHNFRTGTTRLVSRNSDEVGSNSGSDDPDISANGRFVAFESTATNLTDADTNGFRDVFVRDLKMGTTMLASVPSRERPANGTSSEPSISRDGRFVAFDSDANNLSRADDNNVNNIFVRDMQTGRTHLVSQSTGGAPADGSSFRAEISANGQVVAFDSDADNLVGAANDVTNVFAHKLETGRTRLVSRSTGGAAGDDTSNHPALSGDGQMVAFRSFADNLSAADDNAFGNIFVRDLDAGKTILVSRTSEEVAANGFSSVPSFSRNGRFVAFESSAENLSAVDGPSSDIFLRDLEAGATITVSLAPDGSAADSFSELPSVSGTGRFVAFEGSADNFSPDDDDTVRNVFRRGPL